MINLSPAGWLEIVFGVCDPLSEGVLCDVKEVAAVEVRAFVCPFEEVVEDVSRFRLYPVRGGESALEA